MVGSGGSDWEGIEDADERDDTEYRLQQAEGREEVYQGRKEGLLMSSKKHEAKESKKQERKETKGGRKS